MLKKEEPAEPPTESVSKMKGEGLSQDQITQNLERDKYDQRQISDAMNQADIKQEVRGPYQQSAMNQIEKEAPVPLAMQRPQEEPAKQEPKTVELAPSQPQQVEYPEMERTMKDQVEELVESVVGEKWDELISGLGNISLWKEKVRDEITSIKQEILRLEKRFENLHQSVLGKVTDYSKDVGNIGVEMKALEQVLGKIITPLTTNIKELSKITNKLKTKRK
jgi:hypothetical protein